MNDLITIDDLFESATNYVRLNVNNISKENLLYLYARFKQATEGVCSMSRPTGLFNFEAKSKYDAWKALDSMGKERAMNEYVEKLDSLFSNWRMTKKVDNVVQNMSNAGTFGLKMSMMSQNQEDILDDNQKNVFDWCKEGNLVRMKETIDKNSLIKGNLMNLIDDSGMTLLMWACDRGHLSIVKYLLGFTDMFNINNQDNDGKTCLHYAACCENVEIIKELLKNSINVDLVDIEGAKASEMTTNEEILQLLSKI